MVLEISNSLLNQIHRNGEEAYPEEGAGFLLGRIEGEVKQVLALLDLANQSEASARHNRYLLTAEDFMHGELEATRLGLDLLGVFHSHPDHPNQPSDFDREWALPWFSYLITSVNSGKAVESCSWLLNEDRSYFIREGVVSLAGEDSPHIIERERDDEHSK